MNWGNFVQELVSEMPRFDGGNVVAGIVHSYTHDELSEVLFSIHEVIVDCMQSRIIYLHEYRLL